MKSTESSFSYLVSVQKFLKKQLVVLSIEKEQISFEGQKEKFDVHQEFTNSDNIIYLQQKFPVFIASFPVDFKQTVLHAIQLRNTQIEKAKFIHAKNFLNQDFQVSKNQGITLIKYNIPVQDQIKEQVFLVLPHLITKIVFDMQNLVIKTFNFTQNLLYFKLDCKEDYLSLKDHLVETLKGHNYQHEDQNSVDQTISTQYQYKGIHISAGYIIQQRDQFQDYHFLANETEFDILNNNSTILVLLNNIIQYKIELTSISSIIIQERAIIFELFIQNVLEFSFDNCENMQKFLAEIVSLMQKFEVPCRIRKYQLSDTLKIDNQPIQSPVFESHLKMTNFLQDAAFLLRNYPNSLPLEMKDKDLMGQTLDQLSKAEVTQECWLCGDFLLFLLSSRAMYLQILQNYNKYFYIVNKLIIAKQEFRDLGLLLLRNVASFHFQSFVVKENGYYNGIQSSYGVGAGNFKTFREIMFSGKSDNTNYELQQFSAKNNIDVKSFDQSDLAIDGTMVQSSTYWQSRILAERENRNQLLKKGDYLELINVLTDTFEQMTYWQKALFIGLIEDILLSHSHFGSKYVKDEMDAVSSFLPPLRKELTFVASKLIEFLVHAATQGFELLRESCQLILKTMLHENILFQQQKLDIVEIIVSSAGILRFLRTILSSSDLLEINICGSLFGQLYHYSPVVQVISQQVFYPSQLQQLNLLLAISQKFDYREYYQLFGNGYTPCVEFLENLLQNSYSPVIVWDQPIRTGIIQQIDKYIQRFSEGENQCFNYYSFAITKSNLSGRRYQRFDFAVSSCVLSQLLELMPAQFTQILQADLSSFLQSKFLYRADVQLADSVDLATALKDLDSQELVRQCLNLYLLSNCENEKQAILYIIEAILVTTTAKITTIDQYLHEIVNSIMTRAYGMHYYEVRLLEVMAFLPNPSSPKKHMYWQDVARSDYLERVICIVIPELLTAASDGWLELEIESECKLYDKITFGGLLLALLRIIRNSLQFVPNHDKFQQILVPAPKIYELCCCEPFLVSVLNIIRMANASTKQYEQSNIEDYVFKDVEIAKDEQDQDISTAVDFQQQLFLVCTEILRILMYNCPEFLQLFLSFGYMEIILQNPFDAQSNIEFFQILKLLMQKKDVQPILENYLSLPFAYYIKDQKAASSANVFCCKNYLSMNCIWSQWQRQWLQQQLQVSFQSKEHLLLKQLPYYQFELSDHFKLRQYEFLQQYEQYRVHNMYICLLDIYWFTAIFQSTSSNEAKFPSSEDANLLKSQSIERNNELRHQQMMTTLQNQISIEDILNIMLLLLKSDSNVQLDKIQDIVFEVVVQNPQPFVYQTFSFLIDTFMSKLNGEVIVAEQLSELIGNLQKQIREYRLKYGGTDKYIIQKLQIQNPDDIRSQQDKTILGLAKIMLIMQRFSHSLYIQVQKFDELKMSYDNLNNFIDLISHILSCNFGEQFQKLSRHASRVIKNDILYCSQFIQMYDQFKLVMQESLIKIINYIIKQLHDSQEENCDLVLCFNTTIKLASFIINDENFDKINCFEQISQILQHYYQQYNEFNRCNIIQPIFLLLAQLSRFQECHESIMATDIPFYNVVGVFDSIDVAAYTLLNMKGSYREDSKVNDFISNFSVLQFCCKNAKNSKDLVRLLDKQYYTESLIFNSNVRSYYLQLLLNSHMSEDKYKLKYPLTEYLKNDCIIEDYIVGSLLYQYVQQFQCNDVIMLNDVQVVNYQQYLNEQSSNERILTKMADFLVNYLKTYYQLQFQQQFDYGILTNNQNLGQSVPIICALNVIYELVLQQSSAIQSLDKQLVDFLFQLALQLNNNEYNEQVSVLSTLILIVGASQSKLIREYSSLYQQQFIYLIYQQQKQEISYNLASLKMENYSFPEQVMQILQTNMQVSVPLFSRVYYLQYLLSDLIYCGAELEETSILQLYVLLKNVCVEGNDNYKQFCTFTSLKALSKQVLLSRTLQGILPRQFQYILALRDAKQIIDFLGQDVQLPCLVFNSDIRQELTSKLSTIIQQQTQNQAPALDYQSFYQFVDSLNQQYYANGMVISNVVLPLYIESQQNVPDIFEFVNQLISYIVQFSKPEYIAVLVKYFAALTKCLQNQTEAIQIASNNSQLNDLLSIYIFDKNKLLARLQPDDRTLLIASFLATLHQLSRYQADTMTIVSSEFIAGMISQLNQFLQRKYSENSIEERIIINQLEYVVSRLSITSYRLALTRQCYDQNSYCPDFFYKQLQQSKNEQVLKLLLLGFSAFYKKSTDYQQIFEQTLNGEVVIRNVCKQVKVSVGEKANVNIELTDLVKLTRQTELSVHFNTQDLEIATHNYASCRSLSCSHIELLNGISPSQPKQLNISMILVGESARLCYKCLWVLEQGEGWSALCSAFVQLQ